MYRQTGDPKATAELLMHSPSSQMMDRYTIPELEVILDFLRRSRALTEDHAEQVRRETQHA